jgi:hypothetical protein
VVVASVAPQFPRRSRAAAKRTVEIESRKMKPRIPLVLLAFIVSQSAAAATPAAAANATRIQIDEPALQALVDRLAPTLAANEKRFHGRTGAVRGFGAGATYPQIWLRDSATLVDLARFHFSGAHLTSWIEEHLSHQQPDGALFDWIAAGPTSSFAEWAPKVRLVHRAGALQISADKNTVEADQESSAVVAAARAFAFTGDTGWLRKDVAGRTVLDRCDAALSYLLKERRDKASGLVTSGFAADWGDVSPTYGDQRVIYLDEKTPRVVGLYTNALAYEAAVGLAAMQAAAGDAKRAAHWQAVAGALEAAVDKALWQPKAGFYRMHALAPGPTFKADDAAIFGMGGHAVALGAGLVAGPRARGLLDTFEARRRELKLATASFSLLPPFPAGLFQHPAVKEPWSYQNGGQWDWFGGRMVLAEFAHGRAVRARDHLLELARKAQKSGGLFEWHTKDGQGRGSPQYAGSAGALGAAVVHGLLGITLTPREIQVRPRLGAIGAQARLYEPATGTTVEYDYRPSRPALTFRFSVSPARPAEIALLLPDAWRTFEAQVDGRASPARLETVGADRYACLRTDGKPHEIALRPLPRPRRGRQP